MSTNSDNKIVIRAQDLKAPAAEQPARVSVPQTPAASPPPASNRMGPAILASVGAVILVGIVVGAVLLVMSRDEDDKRVIPDPPEVKKVDPRLVREQIEKQAKIDALDEMRKRQPDRLISTFSVEDLVIEQNGSTYLAKMVAKIKSDVVVGANTTTHRLDLMYGDNGQYLGVKRIEDVTTFGPTSPFFPK